tara:strand:+ start:555 stop:1412 length:858 start_codon:yes stop_codon:yes gene_type:complete
MNKIKKELIFLGTGTSEGVPRVSCLTNNSGCIVCNDAIKPNSKNRRYNTSVVIKISSIDFEKNILIDAGKFFYQSAIKWFPKYKINTIDGLILTHAHQDAAGGFDDLRDWTNNTQSTIPIYLREEDYKAISKTFYYLVDTSKITSGGTVAKLNFNIIDDKHTIIEGQKFEHLKVNHGDHYFANGYRIDNLTYISDCSFIPDITMRKIRGSEIIILDSLRRGNKHKSHFTLEEAIEKIVALKPKKAYFTDICHDIEHNEVSKYLNQVSTQTKIKMKLAYDGLRIDF